MKRTMFQRAAADTGFGVSAIGRIADWSFPLMVIAVWAVVLAYTLAMLGGPIPARPRGGVSPLVTARAIAAQPSRGGG